MGKRKNKAAKTSIEVLMEDMSRDKGNGYEISKREVLEQAVAHSSIYITMNKEGMCHITAFDDHVRGQLHAELRAFDALSILHHEMALANFQDFFTQFQVDEGKISKALLSMQNKLGSVSSSEKKQLHDTTKELRGVKESLHKVEQDSRNAQDELKDLRKRLDTAEKQLEERADVIEQVRQLTLRIRPDSTPVEIKTKLANAISRVA